MHCLKFLSRDSLKLKKKKGEIKYSYSKSDTSILNLWDTFFISIRTFFKGKYTNQGNYQSSIYNLKNI